LDHDQWKKEGSKHQMQRPNSYFLIGGMWLFITAVWGVLTGEWSMAGKVFCLGYLFSVIGIKTAKNRNGL
jgi:hypothetical protein